MPEQLISHPLFDAGLYRFTTARGLEVWVLPTPGFARFHAALTVAFGALDLRYRHDGKEVELPAGVAHFLEHQMFTSEQGDAFEAFARLGASANAFTSHDQTTYLFSTTDHFRACLELLLGLVEQPALAEAGVERERSIIEQELLMYEDMPEVRVGRNLREALYHHHPVRYDIGGTVESVRQIDAAVLRRAFATFYHPSNMLLFVAGNVDPRTVEDWLLELPGRDRQPPPIIERVGHDEPPGIVKSEVRSELQVSIPLLQVGFKDTAAPNSGRERLEREVTTNILLNSLCGRGSRLYWELYEQGLAGATFNTDHDAGRDYGITVLAAETEDPDDTAAVILAAVRSALASGVDEETVARSRRRLVGNLVSMFNHPDSVGQSVVGQWLRGLGPMEFFDAATAVTGESVNARLQAHLRIENCAVSVVMPTRQ